MANRFQESNEKVFRGMRNVGVDFLVYVPCSILSVAIELAKDSSNIRGVLATREEEAVGIAVGAYLGGKKPCIILQSSGLGNSVNALTSLAITYKVPLLLLVAHRGVGSERVEAHKPMGRSLAKILRALGIPFFVPYSSEKIVENVVDAFDCSQRLKVPAAVLFNAELTGWIQK
ncbi:MAG: sulfopyruvate decarboxylase subunit alpha [Thermoproteota archaeon]|nr:sulfopyruvate decarboxylase subunit alpha [Thermoproteota archaeon]